MDLGISLCYKVLEQTEGQDVVSLRPSESCGLCVSQTEKQLVAGEPTEEMFYLKELHSRSCLPPMAQGQEFRAGPPWHPGHVDTELGSSTKRFKSLRRSLQGGGGWVDAARAVCLASRCQEFCQSAGKLQVVRVEWHRVCVLLVLPVLVEAVCLSSTLLWQSWCHGAS